MSPPKPDVALKDHCSVVHDNTLYVYSPEAFQSISLEEDAEWKTLEFSVAATGAQCVYGGGALYVVGGAVDASLNYPGLMKYDFAAKSWETITPTDTVAANRQNHGATFLEASSQILVYAGSQSTGDTGASSGTYTIDTAAPYGVSSYPSGGAPNVVAPLLFAWDDSHALMLGGGATQTQIFKFSVANGWENLGVELPAAITDQTTTKCTLVDGDDGSKVLEQYNLGAAPNEVTRLALLGAGGEQATTGQAVGAKKRKRDLSLTDWPSYNSTLAPDTVRTGASIAQDSKGHAVISGGDDADPIAIFDERENTWMNATSFFSGQEPTKISSSSSSTSKSHSATSTSSSLAAASSTVASAIASATSSIASSSATGAAGSSSSSESAADHKNRMMTVLGATLGTICGLAVVLIILLCMLRCKRKKNKGTGGEKGNEKDRLSFADRGVSQFGGPPQTPAAPPYMTDNNASQTSLAIISGKFGNGASKGPKTHTRGLPSDASTNGLVKKSGLAYESHEMSPIGAAPPYSVQNPMAQPPPPAVVGDEKPDRSRSSGWSRYFANNEATNLAGEPYDRNTYASNNSRYSDVSASEYDTNSRYMSQPPPPGKFATPSQLPPLDVSFANNAFDGNRVSRVVTASPIIGNSCEDLSSHGMGVGTPMRAELARVNSVSTIGSFESKRMSQADGQQTWTPIEGNQWYNRTASSLYPDSRPVSEAPFGDGTSSYYPNDGTSSYYPRDGTNSYFPKSNTNSLYPPSLHPDAAKMPAPAAPGRDSTVTIFPRGTPSTVPTDEERQKAIGNQDMSWLKF